MDTAHTCPYIIPDDYLTDRVAHDSFDRFVMDLPQVQDTARCIAFEHVVTMIRFVYTRGLQDLKASAENLRNENRVMLREQSSLSDLVETLKSQVSFLKREITEVHAKNSGLTTEGSVSRSEIWSKIESTNQERMGLCLPDCPHLPMPEVHVLNAITAINYRAESDMYGPVVAALSRILCADRTEDFLGATVLDTHKRRYLGAYAPDVSVVIGGLQYPDPASVYIVIELKHTSMALDKHSLGQAYYYTLALRAAQPHRRYHTAMISNLQDTQFVLLDSLDSRTRHFKAMDLTQAVSYIKHYILVSEHCAPKVPTFTLSLGPMIRRLGSSRHSVVCEFPVVNPGLIRRQFPEEDLGRTMAVKRSSKASITVDIQHEIKILQRIERLGGTSTLARLVYNGNCLDEFGIMPAGDRIEPTGIIDSAAIVILADVISAVEWLHSKEILHRDIRIENVIMHNGRARLIDLGAAIQLPATAGEPYCGGYICCPRELIGDFSQAYTPRKAHDLSAIVLMASVLAFPNTLKTFTTKKVQEAGTESERLKRFWSRMDDSSIWKVYVKAAEKGDLAMLRKMSELFVML